ncbi:MAG: thiamine-phosphate pyrophosphorylase [Thermoleophilaceae bacterium]|nr:thiamine-phosphate pyrophosphorylase [Thermoleophilaceae bacterium]
MTGDERRERLAAARLYLVIEAEPGVALIERALAGGVDVVQLRDKHAPDEAIVRAGEAMREVCARHGALLIVNDHPDLAVAAGADGVHVGQEDAPLADVRELVGPDLLVGISTHTPAQVDGAARSPADYLGVGPVYPTATKPGVEPVGLELVRHAAAAARKPWFAIGGIDAERAAEAAAAGARRIAVVRAIRDAADPEAAARALTQALDREVVGGPAQ